MEDNKKLVEEMINASDLLDGDTEIVNQVIPMSVEGIFGEDAEPLITYDIKEFKKGCKDASYYAGFLTAVLNAGVSEECALQVLATHFTKDDVPMQLEAMKEVARMESEQTDKFTL